MLLPCQAILPSDLRLLSDLLSYKVPSFSVIEVSPASSGEAKRVPRRATVSLRRHHKAVEVGPGTPRPGLYFHLHGAADAPVSSGVAMAEGSELMNRLMSENADLKKQVRLLKENQMLKRLLNESCQDSCGHGSRDLLYTKGPSYPEETCSPGSGGEACGGLPGVPNPERLLLGFGSSRKVSHLRPWWGGQGLLGGLRSCSRHRQARMAPSCCQAQLSAVRVEGPLCPSHSPSLSPVSVPRPGWAGVLGSGLPSAPDPHTRQVVASLAGHSSEAGARSCLFRSMREWSWAPRS